MPSMWEHTNCAAHGREVDSLLPQASVLRLIGHDICPSGMAAEVDLVLSSGVH